VSQPVGILGTHRGHAGTLAHYAEALKRITDSAFKEGEHAE